MYKGEHACGAEGCERKAYYLVENDARCGHHSTKGERTNMRANPNAQQLKEKAYYAHVMTVIERIEFNAPRNVLGAVMVSKMPMIGTQKPEYIDGYMNVFPNFKHATRPGGWGMATLSPKAMGPVRHHQPGLPIAKNLENFHQFSKKFPGESWKEFRKSQIEAFEDEVPHRHKPLSQNKNIPECWVWTRSDGVCMQLSYIQCRQFYCNYYERFALDLDEFKKLKLVLELGMNIRLCGYDGYMPERSLMDHYKDPSRPFGHELVLYTMLTEAEEKWPWRIEKTEDF